MEKRNGVLVENEKHANKSAAKVMRITFLIFSVVFLLNVLGIFVVDMKTMTIAIGSLYFSKRINILTTILSVIGVSVGQILCFTFEILPYKSFPTFYKPIVYGIVPRAMVLIAVAAIFTMLCERTAGLLSNLMNAEEQEQLNGKGTF